MCGAVAVGQSGSSLTSINQFSQKLLVGWAEIAELTISAKIDEAQQTELCHWVYFVGLRQFLRNRVNSVRSAQPTERFCSMLSPIALAVAAVHGRQFAPRAAPNPGKASWSWIAGLNQHTVTEIIF